MTDDPTEMPWAGIAKATGVVGAGAGLLFTALCAAAVRRERREKQESERVRWTDKNRWE